MLADPSSILRSPAGSR